jgi:hypothetical protein
LNNHKELARISRIDADFLTRRGKKSTVSFFDAKPNGGVLPGRRYAGTWKSLKAKLYCWGKSELLEFEASTITIEENEDRMASENNFYQLRFNLVVSRALSRQERIVGWRAAARRNGRHLAAHEGGGQSAGREQFS